MELLINAIAIGYILWSISTYDVPKTFKDGWKQFLKCSKCVSFWIVLLSSGDFVLASTVSLTILILESFIVTKL